MDEVGEAYRGIRVAGRGTGVGVRRPHPRHRRTGHARLDRARPARAPRGRDRRHRVGQPRRRRHRRVGGRAGRGRDVAPPATTCSPNGPSTAPWSRRWRASSVGPRASWCPTPPPTNTTCGAPSERPGARGLRCRGAELRVPRSVARRTARRRGSRRARRAPRRHHRHVGDRRARRVRAHRRLRVRACAHRASLRRADGRLRLGRRVRARAPRARPVHRAPPIRSME